MQIPANKYGTILQGFKNVQLTLISNYHLCKALKQYNKKDLNCRKKESVPGVNHFYQSNNIEYPSLDYPHKSFKQPVAQFWNAPSKVRKRVPFFYTFSLSFLGPNLFKEQDHQRVMVDPILLIIQIYDWVRLVAIALIGLYCPDCPSDFRLP